jgi:hypothetical protein
MEQAGMGGKISHNWKVRMWERGAVDREMAECDNLAVAIAAFEKACEVYPDREITLQHGMRVLREQKGTGIFAEKKASG